LHWAVGVQDPVGHELHVPLSQTLPPPEAQLEPFFALPETLQTPCPELQFHAATLQSPPSHDPVGHAVHVPL
jgi:hypothetical protein